MRHIFLIIVTFVTTGVLTCNGANIEMYVATLNMQNKDESEQATRNRMRLFGRGISAQLPFWTLIGIQESQYTKKREWDSLIHWVYHAKEDKFGCPTSCITAAGILGGHLGTSKVSTRGDIAVMATEFFDLLGDLNIQLEGASDVPVGALIRTAHGTRMRHRLWGQVIPFFSVHTTPSSASLGRRLKEVQALVSGIRGMWRRATTHPLLLETSIAVTGISPFGRLCIRTSTRHLTRTRSIWYSSVVRKNGQMRPA